MTATSDQRPEVWALTDLLVSVNRGVYGSPINDGAKKTVFGALSMMSDEETSVVLSAARTLQINGLEFVLKVIWCHTKMFGSADLTNEDDVSEAHRDMAAKMSCAVLIAPTMSAFGHTEMNADQCHNYTLMVLKIVAETLGAMPSTRLLCADQDSQSVALGISAMHSQYDNWLPPRDRRSEYLWAGEHWQELSPYADVIRSAFEPDRDFLQQLLDVNSVALRHGVL